MGLPEAAEYQNALRKAEQAAEVSCPTARISFYITACAPRLP